MQQQGLGHLITSTYKPVARTCHMSPWNHLGTGRWGTEFQGKESSYQWVQEVHIGAGWVTVTQLEFHHWGPPSPQAVGSLEIPWPQDHTYILLSFPIDCQIPWPQDHTYVLLTLLSYRLCSMPSYPQLFSSHLNLLGEKLQLFWLHSWTSFWATWVKFDLSKMALWRTI